MSYSGGAYAGTPYGGMAGAGALATAADSWAISESIYSLVSKNAPDFWSWSDAATRAVTLSHGSADSFTIADVATRIIGRTLYDSWPVSDHVSPTVGNVRFSVDVFTIADIARRYQAQLVDLPERLVLTAEADSLVLSLAGGLALNPGILTLQLDLDARSIALNSETRTLALKDEGERVGVDG